MSILWRFSDGTSVSLDDRVVEVGGRTTFAERLRRCFADIKLGAPPAVSVDVPPGGTMDMDLAEPWLVARFVRDCARHADVTVTEGPEDNNEDAPDVVKAFLDERYAGHDEEEPPPDAVF